MFDTTKVEKISPEVWLNSQLSVARFYGSIQINGVYYSVDPDDNYLVRNDVFKREMKDKKKKKAFDKAERDKWHELAQTKLFQALQDKEK